MGENYSIRRLTPSRQLFLKEMLYLSLYVLEGGEPFPREVLSRPEISKYFEGWGRAGDLGFVAIERGSGEPVGAIWLRLLAGTEKGYGYVDDETPELGMAVLPEYRGRGIGSSLLKRLLESARTKYRRICLSVSADNAALRLYERAGFERAGENGASVTMVKQLSD